MCFRTITTSLTKGASSDRAKWEGMNLCPAQFPWESSTPALKAGHRATPRNSEPELKPYYENDLATVYCADVLDALREMPDESV